MPRPCLSQHATPDPAGCPVCRRLADPDPRWDVYRSAMADAPPAPTAPSRKEAPPAMLPPPCRHRGAPTGEQVQCGTCPAGNRLKVFGCAMHQRCTVDPEKQANDGTRRCAGCGDREPPPEAAHPLLEATVPAVAIAPPAPGVLDMGGSGVGDGLLGLYAAEGLRKSRPGLTVSYRCGPAALPYVRLFAGWADAAPHFRAHYEGPVPGAAQLNAGYAQERLHPEARVARYCRHAGAPGPAVPVLADGAGLRAKGLPWAGAVLLAPFSHDPAREWPLTHWLALERDLIAAGCRAVVLHTSADRCGLFAGEKLCGADPLAVAAAVFCADLLIGNDSGMAHLAGALGTPALALCGPTSGQKVFSAYPSVLPLDGMAGLTPSVVRERALAWLWRDVVPHTLQSADKLQWLARCVRETNHLDGDVCEAGVFRGGTAKLLLHAMTGGELLLFDTFAGIPEDDQAPGGKHRAGEFACGVEDVLKLLGADEPPHTPTVCVRVGTFPASAAGLEGSRFRLAHLDLDTYQSTRAALEWLVPRMASGGQVVMDDFRWPDCPGVERALADCGLLGRAEPLAPYQCRVRF